MNQSLIAVVGVVILAATAGAQSITVTGTGNPTVDIPAVQAAVNQGGQVVLKGHFCFDAPPTVVELPYAGGAISGMVLVSKAVDISGIQDEQGEMTSIEGGTDPFYVEAPGARVTIQGLHFMHSKVYAIRVVAVSGIVIAANRIEGVGPTTSAVSAITVATSVGPPSPSNPGQPENISGTLSIENNEIDVQGTSAGTNSLGIVVFAVGRTPDKEADIYVSGNKIRNITEPAINVYVVGGRVHVERNVLTTGAVAGPAANPHAIRIVGPGSYLIAHNSIDCGWASGGAAGIHVQGRALPEPPEARAIVVDNDVTMSAPEGTVFGDGSAGIEVTGFAQGNVVLNNRIRGRANFALSVAVQNNGVPENTSFIMNDLLDFTSARADVFVATGATNTIVVGGQNAVEDHGVGTVIVPVTR